MQRAWLIVLAVSASAPAFAGTVQHVPGHIAGWRGGWNPSWHANLQNWPDPAADASFAEFDQTALQAEIDAVLAANGGWDARVIVTQVDWVDDAIPGDLDPVVGSADIDPATLTWFSAYAYNAGGGSWQYDATSYGSFSAAVLAGVAAGDSMVYAPDAAHWMAEWKPIGQEPHSTQDYWNIVIDVPESLITHYLRNPSADGMFVSATKKDGYVNVFGYDQWGGSADIRVVIDAPPAGAPWITPSPGTLTQLLSLDDPVSPPLSVTVNNAGSGTLAWTAAEAPDVPWITLTNASGSDGDAFEVTIDAGSLTPGRVHGPTRNRRCRSREQPGRGLG